MFYICDGKLLGRQRYGKIRREGRGTWSADGLSPGRHLPDESGASREVTGLVQDYRRTLRGHLVVLSPRGKRVLGIVRSGPTNFPAQSTCRAQ